MVFLVTAPCLFCLSIFLDPLLLSEHQLALEIFYMLRALLLKERRDAGKGVILVVVPEQGVLLWGFLAVFGGGKQG